MSFYFILGALFASIFMFFYVGFWIIWFDNTDYYDGFVAVKAEFLIGDFDAESYAFILLRCTLDFIIFSYIFNFLPADWL